MKKSKHANLKYKNSEKNYRQQKKKLFKQKIKKKNQIKNYFKKKEIWLNFQVNQSSIMIKIKWINIRLIKI